MYSSDMTCDSCGDQPVDNRLTCLECLGPNWDDSMDFDMKCMDKDAVREDDGLHHLASHKVMKNIAVMHHRDMVRVRTAALYAYECAEEIFAKQTKMEKKKHNAEVPHATVDDSDRDDSSSLSSDEEQFIPPACSFCKEPVSKPCWYCADCSGM